MSAIARLKSLAYTVAAPLAEPFYSGVGTILMFHHVPAEREHGERVGWAKHSVETPAEDLEEVVRRLQRRGYAVVALEELYERLTKPASVPRATGKVAVLTFDDGYRSVRTVATPLLRSLEAPFTIYLTTGYLDRTSVPWWYLLEDRIRARAGGSLPVGDGTPPLPLATRPDRERAFATLAARFEAASPAEGRALACTLFGADATAEATERLFLSWDDARALARDPLVTVGAHTVTHPVLNALPRDAALREMVESRERIGRELGAAPAHFAYPYGSALQVGEREFALAREAGFATAVTTRCANVFRESASTLLSLPRTYGPTPDEILRCASGVVSALRYRGRRVISA